MNKKRLKNKRNIKAAPTNEYGLGGLIGGGIGAVGGFFAGGPMGAAMGYSAGSSLGDGAESLIGASGNNKRQRRLRRKEELMNRTETSGNLGFMEQGGFLPIGQDAVKIQGPSHEEGGVDLGGGVEVEGQETMDKINGNDYVFSKKLKVPGTNKSFAQLHEELINNGANEEEIQALAEVQEEVSGRSKGGQ